MLLRVRQLEGIVFSFPVKSSRKGCLGRCDGHLSHTEMLCLYLGAIAERSLKVKVLSMVILYLKGYITWHSLYQLAAFRIEGHGEIVLVFQDTCLWTV